MCTVTQNSPHGEPGRTRILCRPSVCVGLRGQ